MRQLTTSSYRHVISSLMIVGTLVFSLAPASAFVHFDFEQKYFIDPGQPILDHTIIEDGGQFHLYYLRGNPAVNIGHATTTDFIHWEILTPVLEPGTWDDWALWAPHIVNVNNFWYMYFTGVNYEQSQQSGLAVSSNNKDWFQLPWPVYHPDTTWAEWADDRFTHGRDPHILEYNGKYYMFLTAKTLAGYGAIACGESTDMINWTDMGPLYVHDNWHVLESVFIWERQGKFHMLFTEELVNGTSHMVSDDLFSGWDISTRTIVDLGHAPQVTFASNGDEIFSRHQVYNDAHGNFIYVHRYDPLIWFGEVPAAAKPWPLTANWTVISGNAFPYQPVFGNNPWVRGEDVDITYEGNCWIGTKENYTGPLGYGYPGQFQGDDKFGVIQSRKFSITGTTMSLLVGGGDFPNDCYVAMIDDETGATLFSETGRNDEEMDRRYWDLRPYIGETVYIEIVDNSTAPFGHINVDDIIETWDATITVDGEGGDGSNKHTPTRSFSTNDKLDDQPASPQLHQNVPNPFNPTTAISFTVPARALVQLDIYNVAGRQVRSLANARFSTGTHTVHWNGRDGAGINVTSGIYFYRLIVDGQNVQTRKMILLK